MGVVRNLMVRAGADFSAITTQAGNASKSMSTMESSVSKSCKNMSSVASGLTSVFRTLGVALSVGSIVSAGKAALEAYNVQAEANAKLTQAMRNTMNARSSEIQSIAELIDAQERLGVVSGDAQTQGAQELSTYLGLSSSLETLIPAMNDMVAQQYGMGASAENAVAIATALGKVMNGQTSSLSRYGYSFTEAQEQMLLYGNEAQKAATLAEVVGASVGGMNEALAATDAGQLLQVSNTLGQIQESFGEAISQVTVLFVPALNVAFDALANLATLANSVAQTLSNVFGSSASSAATAVSYIEGASTAVSDLAETSSDAAESSSKSTFGFDTLQKLSSSSSTSNTSDTSSGDSVLSGTIVETTDDADQATTSIGWLEEGLLKLQSLQDTISFANLSTSLGQLQAAITPFGQAIFDGLSWGYDHVFVPLATWAVESALPGFLDVLSGAVTVVNESISALQPLGLWLFENFLTPVASWTGGVIVTVLEELSTGLYDLSDWIGEHQGLVQGMAVTAGLFCGAWALGSLAEFLVLAGGIPGVLTAMATALWACTGAKLADKIETMAICALYAKDWAVALANNVVALAKDMAAWVALRIEWVVAKASLIATTVAQAAHTAATWAGTAAATAFGAAMAILTSPITLVIAAVAALVAGIVLLWKNWDTVKSVAGSVWESVQSTWSGAYRLSG